LDFGVATGSGSPSAQATNIEEDHVILHIVSVSTLYSSKKHVMFKYIL
jgi:hypothetical protein